jgi:hypothetical protein
MGALDLLVDQIRRSNVSDVGNQLEQGQISPWDVPQKLFDVTGDPQYAQPAADIAKAKEAYANITPSDDPMQNLKSMANYYAQKGDMSGVQNLIKLQPMLLDMQKTQAQTDEAKTTAAKNRFEMGLPAMSTDNAMSGNSGMSLTGQSPYQSAGAQPVTQSPLQSPSTVTGAPNAGIPSGQPQTPAPTMAPVQTGGLGGQAAQQVQQKALEERNTEILAAEKGVQQILSRLPSMKQKLSDMNALAPNTLSGVGVVPSQDSNDAMGWKGELKNQMGVNTKNINNTATFKNLNDQLFVNEIPALMNGASGMRMDIPLVKGVKSASGVPMELNGAGKQQVIGTLNENFDQTKNNALSYYKTLTGQDYDLGKAFQTKQQIADAVKTGVIKKEETYPILRKYYGAQ